MLQLINAIFEIELLDEEKKPRGLPAFGYRGLGTFPPNGKVPFRIRRRREALKI